MTSYYKATRLSIPQFLNVINLVPYYCRLLTRYCAQDFSDSVLIMNSHLTKDVHWETPLKPGDPWITNEKDTKVYIAKHLGNIKLSRSHYIAISIINYDSNVGNMFALEIFTCNFHMQHVNVKISNHLRKLT